MKNTKRFPWALTIVSVLAVAAIVVSVLPGTGLIPAAPTATLPAPSATPTVDDCAPSKIQQEVLDFNKLGREFDDDWEIAQNTPVQDLQSNIEDLQAVRRDSEAYIVSDCLATLKELQLNYMNAYIEAAIALFATLRNPESTVVVEGTPYLLPTGYPLPADIAAVNSDVNSGNYYYGLYQAEMWRLLGITPTPTVTATANPLGPVAPTETATPEPLTESATP